MGQALAEALGGRFVEADDFFWLPSEPPFQAKRPVEERRSLLLAEFKRSAVVVVSGAVSGWGVEVEDAFDFVVFLYLDAAIRIERLRQRELQRFGAVNSAFIEWAAQYDEGLQDGRSLARQRAWLSTRSCPVLHLEGDLSTQERLARIRQWMADASRS